MWTSGVREHAWPDRNGKGCKDVERQGPGLHVSRQRPLRGVAAAGALLPQRAGTYSFEADELETGELPSRQLLCDEEEEMTRG